MLRNGFYVEFDGLDDYYIQGKCWYQKKHFRHDGLISGFDDKNKTFTIVAYDSQWIYRTFQTPQAAFNNAIKKRCGGTGHLNGIRAINEPILLDLSSIRNLLMEYLHSDLELYPPECADRAFGIVTHEYLSLYLERLRNGSIPLERLDRRPFRLIWEHKRCMLDRILAVEQALGLDDAVSQAYAPLEKEANRMHFIYAKYNQKPQAELLSLLQRKLAELKEKERYLLTELVERMSAA